MLSILEVAAALFRESIVAGDVILTRPELVWENLTHPSVEPVAIRPSAAHKNTDIAQRLQTGVHSCVRMHSCAYLCTHLHR